VKVTAVTPSAAASSPSHPDHARWVKESTLAIEANHARASGLSIRAAETENMRQLERLSNRKVKPRKQKPAKKIDTAEQLAKQGVTQRVAPAKVLPPMPACKLCGQCIWCKRTFRVSQLATKARQQDPKASALILELAAVMMAAQAKRDYKDAIGRELPFSRLRLASDIDRAVTQGMEWVCDRSTAFMGQWR
jgi:hypothetical protein